jgi:hypothetical protein
MRALTLIGLLAVAVLVQRLRQSRPDAIRLENVRFICGLVGCCGLLLPLEVLIDELVDLVDALQGLHRIPQPLAFEVVSDLVG